MTGLTDWLYNLIVLVSAAILVNAGTIIILTDSELIFHWNQSYGRCYRILVCVLMLAFFLYPVGATFYARKIVTDVQTLDCGGTGVSIGSSEQF